MTTETQQADLSTRQMSAAFPFLFARLARGTPTPVSISAAQATYKQHIAKSGVTAQQMGIPPKVLAKLGLAQKKPKAEGRGMEWVEGVVRGFKGLAGAKSRGRATAAKTARKPRAATR